VHQEHAPLVTDAVENIAELAADVVEGRLRVPLARAYPLAEAGSALTDFTTGTVSKLAITI
jgi:hypothetical protein